MTPEPRRYWRPVWPPVQQEKPVTAERGGCKPGEHEQRFFITFIQLDGFEVSEQKEEKHCFQQDTSTSNRIGNIRRGRKIIINKGKRSKPAPQREFLSVGVSL